MSSAKERILVDDAPVVFQTEQEARRYLDKMEARVRQIREQANHPHEVR